jgi:hypothetical protein
MEEKNTFGHLSIPVLTVLVVGQVSVDEVVMHLELMTLNFCAPVNKQIFG